MGINAQTSVPKFTIGDVLTAANTNLLTNAPPVFSGTATRDAAFGGAGEKTLAEGQLCYLEDSNIVQYYSGSSWNTVGPTASKIAQVLSTTKISTFSTTSTSFVDVTDLSVSITPTLNTSTILVIANMLCSASNARTITQLVRGATALGNNTSVANPGYGFMTDFSTNAARAVNTLAIIYLDSPATTSATTYKLQIRNDSGDTSIMNRWALNTDFGGSSSITVMEVLA